MTGAKGIQELKTFHVNKMLSGAGAKVNEDALGEFMKEEFGAERSINEASFMSKATEYFESSEPSEECQEVWQMMGGNLTRTGTIDGARLIDSLAELDCDFSKEEIEDFVAFTTKGSDTMTYAELVQALFP